MCVHAAIWVWVDSLASESYYLSLQGGLKFKALRGKESAVRAPQLPPRGCNVEHFSQNGFRTVFCEVTVWAGIFLFTTFDAAEFFLRRPVHAQLSS
jgi:hypothetical protein